MASSHAFLAPFRVILTLQAGCLFPRVTLRSNLSALPSGTLFAKTVYHLSGLTEEGTHLSGPADVAALLLFNYDAACFLETANTNKALFVEAGRR